ncbi:MAG: S-layer homology domain-containing protein, partial [Acidimicrobiia bacterium]
MERAGWGAPRPVRGGLALLIVVLLVAPLGAMAATQSGSGTFVDDDGNVHEGFIEAIAAEGITKGCNPPDNDRYCPSDPITRGQMAAFFRRAFDLPVPVEDFFTDDSDSIFEDDINAIAEAGITKGCNPPGDDRYCPVDFVTRGQMAA